MNLKSREACLGLGFGTALKGGSCIDGKKGSFIRSSVSKCGSKMGGGVMGMNPMPLMGTSEVFGEQPALHVSWTWGMGPETKVGHILYIDSIAF